MLSKTEKNTNLHSFRSDLDLSDHQSSKISSVTANLESCPKIYEELIQSLEADIRKHIRIEHQLKLHMESLEDRIEELERDMETMESDEIHLKEKIKQLNSGKDENNDALNMVKELKKELSQSKLELSAAKKEHTKDINKNQASIDDLQNEIDVLIKELHLNSESQKNLKEKYQEIDFKNKQLLKDT